MNRIKTQKERDLDIGVKEITEKDRFFPGGPQTEIVQLRYREGERVTEQKAQSNGEQGEISSMESGYDLLEKKIRRFMARAKEQNNQHRNRIEYYFIQAILQDTSKTPLEYYRYISEAAEEEHLNFHVLNHLRRYQLFSPGKRSGWVRWLNQTGQQIAVLLQEGHNDYGKPYREAFQAVFKKNDRSLDWKAMLVVLSQSLQEQPQIQKEMQLLTQKMNFLQCRIFLKELLESIGCLRDLRKRKTFQEKLQDTTVTVGEAQGGKNTGEKSLEEEVEDLRASLEITQIELQDLQETIVEIRNEARLEAALKFFKKMNSSRYGNLLDTFSKAEQHLQQLRREDYEIPEKVESIPLVVRMFMKFIREYGIQPQKEMGEEFYLDLEQSGDYNYVGTDFLQSQETKRVRVVSEGWEYCSHTISRPVVSEIKEQGR